MNQIAKMFMESNNRMEQILSGDISLEKISAQQREFEGQIKLLNAVVSVFGVASKNRRALAGLEKMNLMDVDTAVDLMLGDPNDDKIKCPVIDGLITRAECLDYSGTPKNHDDCKNCEIGRSTKAKLLPAHQ